MRAKATMGRESGTNYLLYGSAMKVDGGSVRDERQLDLRLTTKSSTYDSTAGDRNNVVRLEEEEA
jgi:hypothetical protein